MRLPATVMNNIQEVNIHIGLDGTPLSQHHCIWPILGRLIHDQAKDLSPFLIGIYEGQKDPQDAQVYLQDLTSEMNFLNTVGVLMDDGVTRKPFKVSAFIMDSKARSSIAGVIGCPGHDGCGKCDQHGHTTNSKVVYSTSSAPSDSVSDSELIKTELQDIKNILKEHGQDLKYLKIQAAKKSYDENVSKRIKKILPLSTMDNFKKLDAELHMEKWQEAYSSVVAYKRSLKDIITDDIACDLSMSGKTSKTAPEHKLVNFGTSRIYRVWKDMCNDKNFDTKISKELDLAKQRVYTKRSAAKKKSKANDGSKFTDDGGNFSGADKSTETQDGDVFEIPPNIEEKHESGESSP
ncbi:hypothetical protein DMENIID0001_140550 [Sergentomyia squamirostris]